MPFQSAEAAREGRDGLVTTSRRSRSFPDPGAQARHTAVTVVVTAAAVVVSAIGGAGTARAAGELAPAPPGPVDAATSDAVPQEANRSVVVARRVPEAAPREDLTAAASVLIPANSLRANEDLGTLLLEVPGANVTRRGGFGSFATLSLRGSNPDEVRLYIDGIPLNQAVGGAVDLATLPLGDVERVEIYRGSSPIAFGESALGGIVSISTRTPGTPAASARGGVGSFRTAFADATAGGSVGRLKLYAGVHTLRAIGDFPYAAPDVIAGYQPSARQNTDLTQLDGVVRATLPLGGRRELRAGFIGIWRDQGLPTEGNFRAVAARSTTGRLLGHLGYESRDDLGSSSRLRASLFASGMWDAFSDPFHEIVGVPTATRDLTRTLGATVSAEKALGDWVRLTGLAEGRGEQYQPHNDLDPTTSAGYPATRKVVVTGVEADVHVEPLKLDVLPSARLEMSRDVRTGRSQLFGTHLPPGPPTDRVLPVFRLGLLRPLGGGAVLRGNLGRYARLPTFLELYGYNRGVIGNPTLRPERGVNADLGVAVNRDGPTGAVGASATMFGALVDDLISWDTFNYQTRAENTSRARVWGIETEVRVRRHRLTAVAQATLTDARDRGNVAARRDRQLAHHPRERGYARTEWRQPIGAAMEAAGYVDLEGSAGNVWTTGPFSPIAPRLLVGAGIVLTFARTGLRLAASAVNLGDSRVQDFPAYPQPGRSVFVALGWSSAPAPFIHD